MAKKRQTFGKLQRERERAEKRARKQEKKEMKKAEAEEALTAPESETSAEVDTPTVEEPRAEDVSPGSTIRAPQ
jgi:hypothetical protein